MEKIIENLLLAGSNGVLGLPSIVSVSQESSFEHHFDDLDVNQSGNTLSRRNLSRFFFSNRYIEMRIFWREADVIPLCIYGHV